MYCSQCGRQVPDGSRYCNFCGAAIAVNDMNPDERPEEEHYQYYGAFDAPKGFETLPYNKHGYARQTTNSQQTQVPKGGFVQKDYTQKPQVTHGGPAQSDHAKEPWKQDFAICPAVRKRKWFLPLIIGAAVLLLALAAVLFFCCGTEDLGAGGKNDALQANLCNWGYACKMGEDYYVVVPEHGLLRLKEEDLKKPLDDADPEPVQALPFKIGNVEYSDVQDLVPVGSRLYYQMPGYDPDTGKNTFCYCVCDTETGKIIELFTVTGSYCYGLDLVEDSLYFCLDGDLYCIDTTVSPEAGEACKKDCGIRLGDDPNVAFCPEGILMAEQGSCTGLKLVSLENKTLRTYDEVRDQELYIDLVWNGYAYFHREDAEDTRSICRIDLATGECSVFASLEDLRDPYLIRINAYGDRIFMGITREPSPGIYQYSIMTFREDGELRQETSIPDAPESDLSLLCMVNAGEYMITRLVLSPGSPAMRVFTLPDLMIPH